MLNRVIGDIFYLRRVHSVLPDVTLGNTLKNKLLRLSLQPSLQQLKEDQQRRCGHAASSSSSASASITAVHSGVQNQHRSSSGTATAAAAAAAASPVPSPTAINPYALCHLLDCLAYFHLGMSVVAKEAVQLVQLTAPTMSPTELCPTLAACCALGAQHDITATALPLLSTALCHYRRLPTAASMGAPVEEQQPLIFAHGASILLLVGALQKAGVREREVWHLIAEHCLQHLEALDGRQLSNVVRALCAEGIDNYPDFFVAAERHITSQPPNYLTPDLLLQVVQCYKELHQPVVGLLAVMNATPLHAEDFDRSIGAAATVAALSGPQVRAGGAGASPSPRAQAASSVSVQHSLEVFESAAASALVTADAQAVLELVVKCQRRRVMTARVMDTVLRRLLVLFYPALSTDVQDGQRASAAPAGGASEGVRHETVDLHRLSQCLVMMMEFNDAALFVAPAGDMQAANTKEKKPPGRGAAATSSKTTTKPHITVLLDAMSEELGHWYHPRLLQIVPHAVKLLPAAHHPRAFFTALVAHLRRSTDLSSHEGPAKLRCLVEALLALRPYGGETTLVSLMPVITVAVLNAPRTEQLLLTSTVAHLPCTSKELLPGVYRQWGTQKRWLSTITEEEVGYALQVMARSGQRDSPLLHAVVAFVQTQRGQLPPQRVVDYLHQLARLGVRDLELFTQTAEHLMRRAVEGTPSALRGRGGDGGGGRARSDQSSAAADAVNSAATAGGEDATVHVTAPSSFAAVKHQQWQITTVHDLSLLLYTFTFVLRDSIRVTQQIIARLKMCSRAATPRDVSLALYSFVKLRVRRNDEVTGQLGERAAATLADFTASEVASTWSSLRCLHHPHQRLHQQTLELLDAAPPSSSAGEGTKAGRPRWRFTDADCLSLGSALLLTAAAPLNPEHPLVLRRAAASAERGAPSNISLTPLPPATATAADPVFVVVDEPAVVLPSSFERHYLDVCRRLLPTSTGQRLYLILCSLCRCATMPPLSQDAWVTVLKLVDTHAESLSTGRLGDVVGEAQLEVLDALRLLHRHVADPDALAAADAVRVESSKWIAPYCPPGLWTVLRPRWRELTRSVLVQTRPSLLALVAEFKGVGGVEPAKESTLRRSLERRDRKA